MSFQNWPISRKLTAAFALLIAIFVGVSALIWSNLSSLQQATAKKDQAFNVSRGAEKMMGGVLEQMNAVRGFSILGKEEFFDTYRENKDELAKLAAEARSTADDAEKGRIDAFMAAVDAW